MSPTHSQLVNRALPLLAMTLVFGATLSGPALVGSADALAGQQSNPMRTYTDANVEHLIYYTSEGLKLSDHLYEPIGRNRYETVIQPDGGCARGKPGRRVGVLEVKRDTVVWSWTHYLGCGRRVMTREKRLLHQFKRKAKELCRPARYTYRRKSVELTVHDQCDGTLTVEPPDIKADILISRKSRDRFQGRANVPGNTWSLRFRWTPRTSKLRPRGRLKTDAGTVRFTGTWILVATTPAD